MLRTVSTIFSRSGTYKGEAGGWQPTDGSGA
jgi:hypothetical protein